MTDPVLSSLLRINQQRMRLLRSQALTPNGYVGTMHLIVLYTGRRPGARQEDVVCFYNLDKASVARDARRLEQLGHLRRELDPDNRRQYRLFLTAEGEALLAVLERTHPEFQRRLSAGISQEDWRTLTALLARLEENSCQDPAPSSHP